MFAFIVIVGALVLIISFWKDVIPATADFLSVAIGAVWAWYMFWWIVEAIFG